MRGLDVAWERAKVLRSWRGWLERIVGASREVLSSKLMGVYLFGSAVTGRLVAASDVDVLIVAKDLPRAALARSQIRAEIEERAGLPQVHPFEIHLVDLEEAEIYFKHIERLVKLYEGESVEVGRRTSGEPA